MKFCRRFLQYSGRSSAHGGSNNPFSGTSAVSSSSSNPFASSPLFNGNFVPQDASLDPAALMKMREHMQVAMSPEVQSQMKSMMGSMSSLFNHGGDGMPKMGMMAFGVGENERGKRVARGAKMEFDPNTGKVVHDFHEQQLDPDDVALPKETVEDYNVEGAVEVEFAEDVKKVSDHGRSKAETLSEAEIEVECVDTKEKGK